MSSSKADHSQGLLLFRLHNQQTFALGTLKIQELVPFQPVTPMVNQHASILGALTIRGQTMPIVDLAAAVGKGATPKELLASSFIIITDVQRQKVGFLVRQIERIADANWRDIVSWAVYAMVAAEELKITQANGDFADLRLRIGAARADQAGELLDRHAQFEGLDAEEVADALEVVRGRPALPGQVAVELGAVERQLAADLGNRAVVAAKEFEIGAEGIGHTAALR